MIYDIRCHECDHKDEIHCTVAQKEEIYGAGVDIKVPNPTCPKCGKAALYTAITSAPAVFYRGDWGRTAWTHNTQGKGSIIQRDLDAALRENDALQEAPKVDPRYIKAGDAIKRAEDAATKQGNAF